MEGLRETFQIKAIEKEDVPVVPWFPLKRTDLDTIGTELMDYFKDNLKGDHPHYTDMSYAKRCQELTNIFIGTSI